jgi:hydroxylysine kinase
MAVVPHLSPDQAGQIARRCYGISGTAMRLATEVDDAFRVVDGDGTAWLLKIGPPDAAPGPGPSFQTALLLYLAGAAPALPVQRVTPALDGCPEVALDGRLARMTTWLDGRMLSEADQAGQAGPAGTALRRDIGATLARLDRALRDFRHPAVDRTHSWDLRRFGALGPLLDELPPGGLLPEVRRAAAGPAAGDQGDPGDVKAALADCVAQFARDVVPRLADTPAQVIHADFHGENLLTDGGRVSGILDFGDALEAPVAMDLGIAACYQLGGGPDVLAPALDVVAGYHAVSPLSPADLELTAQFLVARVATRIIVSQRSATYEPANRGYLLRRTPQAVRQLMALRRLTPDEIAGRLRAACLI